MNITISVIFAWIYSYLLSNVKPVARNFANLVPINGTRDLIVVPIGAAKDGIIRRHLLFRSIYNVHFNVKLSFYQIIFKSILKHAKRLQTIIRSNSLKKI